MSVVPSPDGMIGYEARVGVLPIKNAMVTNTNVITSLFFSDLLSPSVSTHRVGKVKSPYQRSVAVHCDRQLKKTYNYI